jgi:hypothetical protein
VDFSKSSEVAQTFENNAMGGKQPKKLSISWYIKNLFQFLVEIRGYFLPGVIFFIKYKIEIHYHKVNLNYEIKITINFNEIFKHTYLYFI